MLKKFILYAKLKELRSAWVFFIFSLGYGIILFVMLQPWLALLFLLFAIGFLVYLIWHGINAAKTNFALKIEKNQNAAIIAGFSEGVIAYDQSFRIISINQAGEAITGVSKEELVGQIISPEWAANPRYKIITQIIFPSLAAKVVKKTLSGWPQVTEVTIMDPRELHLEISTNQIFDENGRLIGFIKVVRDRSREIELLRSKSEFITVAAHQMRTPLAGIRWALDGILKGSFGEFSQEQKTILEQTLSAVERITNLVDDLLNVAKIEEGRFGYSMSKQDIVSLIREVLESLTETAQSHSVRLILYPPKDTIPQLLLDREKIAMAFQNIIENGILYNVKNGEVRVSIELLKDQPYVQITIQDTGIGMSEKELAKLFTKFFRGEAALKLETEGSGLGLYIARNIILRHGGDIRVKSIEKRGTTFTILLPTEESLVPPTEVFVTEAL